MKKFITLCLLSMLMVSPVMAGTHGKNGQVSGRSVGASLCSLLLWPGIGQAINDQNFDKNATHAILGLTGVFRFWSFYDALIDRQGGVWNNRI
ncbi:MAG: hypothetical protein NC200_06105 [Candidatus Gastranaerophilales bacterium]|nr:hypothetical protein [Candidatus Gastranaerophilales bacterium]